MIAVTVVTAMIATIAHLDGTTAVTVLITIPAMYPVYKRMNIDARILLCITGACMGVMNLLPWGGPTARAATVLQMDATELWHMLIPLQIVGLVMNSVIAVLLGMYAVKKGAGAGKGVEVETNEKEKAETEALKKSRGYLIFNFLLTVAVIVALSTGVGKSYVIFMLGLCVLLAVNYPDQKIQDKLVKKHAPAALIISATLFAAGAMVGILMEQECWKQWQMRSWRSFLQLWENTSTLFLVSLPFLLAFVWEPMHILRHHASGHAGWRNIRGCIPEHSTYHADRKESGANGKSPCPGYLSGYRIDRNRIKGSYEIQHSALLCGKPDHVSTGSNFRDHKFIRDSKTIKA